MAQCICSWILHMLGMLGVGPICLYIAWHVPCQSPRESWSPGIWNACLKLFFLFMLYKFERSKALLLVCLKHRFVIINILVDICKCYVSYIDRSSWWWSMFHLIYCFASKKSFMCLTCCLQLALYILVAGILCVYINYDCDRQRQEFRRTNGKCLVWGKAPSKVLVFLYCIFDEVFLYWWRIINLSFLYRLLPHTQPQRERRRPAFYWPQDGKLCTT